MDAAQEVKTRLDIADVVGEYLPLKPAGMGSFKAPCPFHHEKTPSFFVNRPRQSWHCFGCDKGGDLISFVMGMEGMEFGDALQHLAQKAGVTLPSYNPEVASERKRLIEVNELASRYFRAYLLQAQDAALARAYVSKRGVDDLTGDIWRIGYAPEGWSGLADALRKKDVRDDEMLKAGLVIQGQRGVYDRFRGRIMFPIWDVHGHVIGFTGRILTNEKDQAKYVNTPETSVYKKSLVLYGLDKAKAEIRRQDLAVIVEGNMDVVSSHQFNVPNVIACSGTALTEQQLQLLKRFTSNLAIAFDADAAGGNATLRGLDLARKLDFLIKIITLPPEAGKDPDEAVRKDPTLWTRAIAEAVPVMEWLYRRAFRGKDAHRPEQKRVIASELVPEFARIANAVERDAWVLRLAQDLQISEAAIRESMAGGATSPPRGDYRGVRIEARDEKVEAVRRTKTPEDHSIERVLAILSRHPEWIELANSAAPTYPWPHLLAQADLGYLGILADREFPDDSASVLQQELDANAKRLHLATVAKYRAELQDRMAQAERAGDDAQIRAIMQELSNLST